MTRRLRLLPVMIVLALIVLALCQGCSVDTDLGGVRIPNARPDTRLTGQPPTLLEAGFTVEFRWTGVDPDGRIAGYQWKISDNGTDGISARDTLTYDPTTGAVLNPWRFTTAADSVFLVLADIPDFEGDPESDPRSWRTHTIFVRAVDDKGAVDPTPAHMSFTSTTLTPKGELTLPYYSPDPNGGGSANQAPPTVTVGYTGEDPDYDVGLPTKIRFLWKRAAVTNEFGVVSYITQEYYYDQEMIDFDDPDWSEWLDFEADEDERSFEFPNQPSEDSQGQLIAYFFALQVRDVAGAVSVERGYNAQVANLTIGRFSPNVTLYDPYLAETQSDRRSTIAAYQPLNFSWSATAASYNGRIVSYRYGWDVINPDDPNDTNWAVSPGLSDQHLRAPEKIFAEGTHTFYLLVVDNSDQETLLRWDLEVIPFVDEQYQLPLLVIDQIDDEDTTAWPSEDGQVFYNSEDYRNEFWRQTLAEGAGSVTDFNWDAHHFGHVDNVLYEDAVKYKALALYTRWGVGGTISYLRPSEAGENFNWLAPYQDQGGNLLFCGASSLYGLVFQESHYAAPMIFDTSEESLVLDGEVYITGFGERELPNGETVLNGPLYYPYAVAGVAVLDWASPNFVYLYGRTQSVSFFRNRKCVSLKGLYLDEDFQNNPDHLIGPGEIADYIGTEDTIDWRDLAEWNSNLLTVNYLWAMDEFYDENITSTRPTPYSLQECEQGPNGYCVEPMFRGQARYDWLRDRRWELGETGWPYTRYSDSQIASICGSMALTPYEDLTPGSALTNGRVYGFLSYKNVTNKPRGNADVYWGFDPYRFDHTEAKKAIRWVMQYFGLQLN